MSSMENDPHDVLHRVVRRGTAPVHAEMKTPAAQSAAGVRKNDVLRLRMAGVQIERTAAGVGVHAPSVGAGGRIVGDILCRRRAEAAGDVRLGCVAQLL